jgi:hypothetical protein
MPNVILRLEGFALLIAALVAFIALKGSALLFALLLFAPDLGMLGYLANVRVGSVVYNIIHTWIIPAIILALGLWVLDNTVMAHVALVWLAHIGMDRVLGFGIKYPTFFADTHLQHV